MIVKFKIHNNYLHSHSGKTNLLRYFWYCKAIPRETCQENLSSVDFFLNNMKKVSYKHLCLPNIDRFLPIINRR